MNETKVKKVGVYSIVKEERGFSVYREDDMLHSFEYIEDAESYVRYQISRDEAKENEKKD